MREMLCAVVGLLSTALCAGVYYVTPTGTGSGSSWSDPASIEVLSTLQADDEAWLKEGAYSLTQGYTLANPVTVRGGFTGDEISAETRNPQARSVLNGGNSVADLLTVTATTGTVVLEGLAFTAATAHAVIKQSGNASLSLRQDSIYDMTPTKTKLGHALWVKGATDSSVLTLDNVTIERVRDPTEGEHPAEWAGWLLRIDSFKEVVMNDCLIEQCGCKTNRDDNCSGRENNPTLIYVNASPVHAKNVRLIGNRFGAHGDGRGGALFRLCGDCNGSFFKNCLMAANCSICFSDTLNLRGAALAVDLGGATQTVAVENCTIAYNVTGTGKCAGISVSSGTVNIANSIIFGNEVGKYGVAADLLAWGANAQINVAYSLVTDAKTTCAATAGTLNLAASVFSADPRFVTTRETFKSDYYKGKSGANSCCVKGYADFAALDFHLMSTQARWNGTEWVKDADQSPAIDAGDPAADAANEPSPSRAIDLGYYGNTAEASAPSLLKPVLSEVVFVQPDASYRGRFSITMGGDAGYSATTYLCYGMTAGEGLEGWDHVVPFWGTDSGDVLESTVNEYHTTGTRLYWLVCAENANGRDEKTGEVVYAGSMPQLANKAIDQSNNFTKPLFSATLTAAEEGTSTLAEVYFCYGLAPSSGEGLAGWEHSRRVGILKTVGDTIEMEPLEFVATGTKYYYRWVAVCALGTAATPIESVSVSGNEPPGFGCSCGADVIHVWSSAKGCSDGSDWMNACTNLVMASEFVAEGRRTICVAGDLQMTAGPAVFEQPVTIIGGFAGNEQSLDERTGTNISEINGQGRYQAFHLAATTGESVLRHLLITNCPGPAVMKSGKGDLRVEHCSFIGNGLSNSCWGMGLQSEGLASSSALTVQDCYFTGNFSWSESSRDHSGMALSAKNFKTVTVTGCRFVKNGPPKGNNNVAGRTGTRGGVVRCDNAPLTMTGCTLVGNRVLSHRDSGPIYTGGMLALTGNSGGSVIRNCAFVANEGYGVNDNGAPIGCLVILNDDAQTCNFENCTWAYNAGYLGSGSAVCVYKGKVTIRNSIFHGNRANDAPAGTFTSWSGPYTGHDLYVSTASSESAATGIDVDDCFFDAVDAAHCADGANAGRIKFGANIRTGDPLLMTPECAIEIKGQSPTFALESTEINVHLQSKTGYFDEVTGELVRVPRVVSPAIDAGAKVKDGTLREPKPNGGRLNYGYYGNTPWASMSATAGLSVIVR